ncbi:EI24 isoform 7 [Pan troglodytes]|uniref:EI24 autophagy associated transmembrane protein n=3 Tax=Hominidae TaxID=9604 RepID=A0A087WV44_HUMAN|nr:EI24 isoform 7 [Pan troglodytes]PNJ75323.1 EI24 isoform 7 [Pongo abelii]
MADSVKTFLQDLARMLESSKRERSSVEEGQVVSWHREEPRV